MVALAIITDSQLEYFGRKFTKEEIRKKENITFEEYLKREIGDRNGT